MLCRPRFMIANFNIVGVLTACNSVALSMAPLSLIAPFAGLTMIWSAWFAHCGCFGVRERLHLEDVGCTALVLGGALLVSIVGADALGAAPELSLDRRLSQLMADATSALFVGCWVTICILGYMWLTPASNGLRKCWPVGSVFCSAFLGAACAALTTAFVKLFATAIAGALAGGVSAPPTWFIVEALVGVATCAPLDLLLLARTTGDYALALAVPIYQSLIVLLSAAAGGLFFAEFEYYGGTSIALFVVGIGIVVMGMAALGFTHARRQKRAPAPPDEIGTPPRKKGESRILGVAEIDPKHLELEA